MVTIGSAQAIKIVLSIMRLKMLAVLLGPTGIGLLSIYNNLQGTVSKAAGLGLAFSGVRQLASAQGESVELERIRRVLIVASVIQGALAMVGVWLMRYRISVWLFGNVQYSTEVGLIGLAILLTLLSSSQQALLQGLRRIGDLARVTVLGAFCGTVAGLAAVWFYGKHGLIWFVLVQPLTAFIVALWFARRLTKTSGFALGLVDIWTTWRPMVQLGAAFMLGGLATAATLLVVRGYITQELGLNAAGQFAASWGIAMTYVAFLLGAMGADYYPRLTEVIMDRPVAIRLMNDQAQLGLAIGGPVLLLLIGLAPWIIELLYSPEFGAAAKLLQWQTVGNVFKLASWALSFSIVAAARPKTYFFMEMSFNIVFLATIWFLLPLFGLVVAGIGFLLGYVVYFATVNQVARCIHSFRWQPFSLGLLASHVTLAIGLLSLALLKPSAAAFAAPVIALASGVFGLRVVLSKIGTDGRIPGRLNRIYDAIGWPIRGGA